jgi:hypothetical protein
MTDPRQNQRVIQTEDGSFIVKGEVSEIL